jgi:DNA-binding Xre family transcriptional regulator
MINDIEIGQAGESLEDFLKEDGVYEEVNASAIKNVIAWQLSEVMKADKITKVELARRLATSRTQVDRLLDPHNEGVSIGVLQRAAIAVGRELSLQLR